MRKDSKYFLEQMKQWCFKLHAKRWWQPAVVEKILIKHYVDKYLTERQGESEKKLKEHLNNLY